MAATAILSNLNAEQRAAVSAESQQTLVLAGAGSGKTRVLTHRVAWLHEQRGIALEDMLVLTFTNKAANEMRQRLRGMLRVSIYPLWIGTFHGICYRLLQRHYEQASLPKDFQVLDADDQLRFVKRIMAELNIDPHNVDAKKVRSYINRNKERGDRAANTPQHGLPSEREMHNVYVAYEKACRVAGVADFAELLLAVIELIRDNEAIARRYREKFKAILVDEFQDTNALQFAICRLLSLDDAMLFAVGDDDQSIYSWRGAQPANMLDLQSYYPKLATYRLERNYRSTGNILKVANELIARNASRLGKNLVPDGGEGDKVVFHTAFDEDEEAAVAAGYIHEWRDAGRGLSEVAILYRSHMQSRALEAALRQNDIPYRIYGGLRFYERAEIKDALAYLQLVSHARSDVGFQRVINTPLRGIGATTQAHIRQVANARGLSLWDACAVAIESGALPSRAAKAVGDFCRLIERLQEEVAGKPLHEKVAKIIHGSGLYAQFAVATGTDIQKVSKRENLDELIGDAMSFEERYKRERGDAEDESDADIGDDEIGSAFITHATLEPEQQRSDEASLEYVQLMTLHAAKGLEFPFVIMTGLEENLLPHRLSLDEENSEEERRLCYVGITRARERLVMMRARKRYLYGGSEPMNMSRFICDLPEALFEWRPKSSIPTPSLSAQRDMAQGTDRNGMFGGDGALRVANTPRSEAAVTAEHVIGRQVSHSKFGEGVIEDCEGDGEALRVRVIFDGEEKWLVWQYANLELLD